MNIRLRPCLFGFSRLSFLNGISYTIQVVTLDMDNGYLYLEHTVVPKTFKGGIDPTGIFSPNPAFQLAIEIIHKHIHSFLLVTLFSVAEIFQVVMKSGNNPLVVYTDIQHTAFGIHHSKYYAQDVARLFFGVYTPSIVRRKNERRLKFQYVAFIAVNPKSFRLYNIYVYCLS